MKRNYGIDLLRILAMIMVPILHVLGQGGILNSLPKLSTKYELAWLLETASYCAVNCFALISGYVGISTTFRYYKGLVLWLQVTFFTVLITGFYAYTMPDIITAEHWKQALTPVSSRQYWYFTAYFTLFLFIPFINSAINSLSLKQLKILGITIVTTLSCWETVTQSDLFCLKNGYSFLWLTALYILGAIIKKTEFGIRTSKISLFILYCSCTLLSWGFKHYFSMHPMKVIKPDLLISYISPTILISAIALLLLFSKLTIRSTLSIRLIKLFSPLAFSVYIIHVHPLIWINAFKNRFVEYSSYPVFPLVLHILLAALSIFLLCAAIDFIRHYLFSLLHINEVCRFLLSFTESKETSSVIIPFVKEEETVLIHTSSDL
ncbi:MAG: acyltransferase [bacterium]|nr:acyltransferase [bacterium]